MAKRSLSFLALGLILTLPAIPCHAKLGESLAPCVAEYGKPTSEIDPSGPRLPADLHIANFKKEGYDTIVTFIKGISTGENFSKEDRSVLSAKEVTAILQADTAGGRWTQDATQKEFWHRLDGALATYPPNPKSGDSLGLMSQVLDKPFKENHPIPPSAHPPP